MGFNDLNSADLPAPGTTTIKSYFLNQDATLKASINSLAVDSKTDSYVEMLLLSHVTKLTLLGARYGFAALMQTRVVERDKGEGAPFSDLKYKSSTVGGFGDMVLWYC